MAARALFAMVASAVLATPLAGQTTRPNIVLIFPDNLGWGEIGAYGAVMASNYLVTLYRAAARLTTTAGAPAAALVPLMRRTIDNGFDLTGPIARGDWTTLDAHLDAIRRSAPDLEPMYRALAEATSR